MDWTLWGAAALLVSMPGTMCCLWLRRVRAARVGRGAALDARRADLDSLDERVTRLANALSMLTDTAESGLREAFGEIERLARERRGTLTGPAPLQQRIEAAARDGQSTRVIAVSEGLAESEVLLRLGLAARRPEEAAHAAVR